jgi:hypothetical protein
LDTKSGPGSASFSDLNSGTSTASVNIEGTYVFSWTIANGACPTSIVDINVEFYIPPEAAHEKSDVITDNFLSRYINHTRKI